MPRKRKESKGTSPNSPDYILKMRSRQSEHTGWTRVGVMWNADRGYTIKLNRGVILDWHDFTDDSEYVLMAFPNDDTYNG